MDSRRGQGTASGCAWLVGLAVLAWLGLGAPRGAGSGLVDAGIAPAAKVIDRTPPRLDPSVSASVVTRRGVVLAEPGGVDAASGIERQGCNGGRALSTRRLGVHRVTCFARDRAGNLATAHVQYLVVDQRQRKS
jgi:hypothetical protein